MATYTLAGLTERRALEAALATAQKQVAARFPEIQRLAQSDPQLARYWNQGTTIAKKAALKIAAERLGIALPKDYHPDLSGRIVRGDDIGNFIARGSLIVGSALLPGLGAGAGGAGGAGAVTGGATGAGAGIGTTGAGVAGVSTGTTGVLAGSAGVTAAGLMGSRPPGTQPPGGSTPPVSTKYSWLNPLLRTALPVAGSVINTILQRRGENDALALEAEALEKALAAEREQQQYDRAKDKEQTGYDRGQYANYLGRLDPYAQAGPPAVTRLSDVLGRPGAIPNVGMGGMVTLRSPDGQTRQVPADQADYYLSRGATKV